MDRKIDKAFNETASLLLGRPLGGVDSYSGWLGEHVPLPFPAASAVSGKEIWMAPPINFLDKRFDSRRIIDMAEMEKVNVSPFGSKEMEAVENLGQLLGKFVSPIAYYCGNFRYGAGQDIEPGRHFFHGHKASRPESREPVFEIVSIAKAHDDCAVKRLALSRE